MAALSDLPPELLLQIFSGIKYEDRFETCQVSYEWFFLSLKTYQDKMTSENDLLVSMADFFNKAMGAKKYSSWIQLYRYMKPSKVEISSSDSPAYFKTVEKCKTSIKVKVMDMGQFLMEFWKSYPNLKSISVRHGEVPEDKVKVLKDAFGSLLIPRLVFEESPRYCFDIQLKRIGSTFALSTISLMFGDLPNTVLTTALKAIKECQTVDTFVILNPFITSKWEKVFPSSVRILLLIDPVIQDSVVPHVKDLLFYLCKDWSSLRICEIRQPTGTKYQYFPRDKSESFHIYWPENPSHFTHGFECRKGRIHGLRNLECLKNSLPASMEFLELICSECPKEFSPRQLFSGPPKLQTLALDMPIIDNLTFGDFTGLTSLHTLLVDCIGPKTLETIFLSLPSLKHLVTRSSEEGTFTCLPMKVVSKSLKELTIKNTCVNNSFILRHVPNLKHLSIHEYDPKQHQVGFLCSSFYNLDFVAITGKFDSLLCRAIGSDLADYPYKCIVAEWSSPSINYTYVLSREVEPLRSFVCVTQAKCIEKLTIYAHGFSVAYLNKKPNLKTYSRVDQFLNDFKTQEHLG